MAKALDVSTLDPAHAKKILSQRLQKKIAYQMRKDELLARNKAWRQANPELASQISVAWKAQNQKARERRVTQGYVEGQMSEVRPLQTPSNPGYLPNSPVSRAER